MDKAAKMRKESIAVRYRRKLQSALQIIPSSSSSKSNGNIHESNNLEHPSCVSLSNSRGSFSAPPTNEHFGHFQTFCLLCSKSFSIPFESTLESHKKNVERSKMLKNLCLNLFLNQEHIPLVCYKANAPLCDGCEEDVTTAWNKQRVISKAIDRIEKRVSEMPSNQTATSTNVWPFFEAQKLTNFRNTIFQACKQKLLPELPLIEFQINDSPSALLNLTSQSSVQNHTSQGPEDNRDYGGSTVNLTVLNADSMSNLSKYSSSDVPSTLTVTTVTTCPEEAECLTTQHIDEFASSEDSIRSMSTAAHNLDPNLSSQIDESVHKKGTGTFNIQTYDLNNINQDIVKKENSSSNENTEVDNLSDNEQEEILVINSQKRRLLRLGTEFFRCEDRFKRPVLQCSICNLIIPVSMQQNQNEMRPYKRMDLHLQEFHQRLPKDITPKIPCHNMVECSRYQPVATFSNKTGYAEDLNACPNIPGKQKPASSKPSTSVVFTDGIDDEESIMPQLEPMIETDTECIGMENETDQNDDDDECIFEIKSTERGKNCHGVEFYHLVDLAKDIEFISCSRCNFRLQIPIEAKDSVRIVLQVQMENHIQSVHKKRRGRQCKKRMYYCELCNKKYIRRKWYRHHMTTHSDTQVHVGNSEQDEDM